MKTIVNPFSGGLIAIPNSSVNLGNKKHTRASLPPTLPVVGDTWEELDAAGNYVYFWSWNGTYWLGQDIKEVSINLSSVTIAGNHGLLKIRENPINANYFYLQFKVGFFVAGSAHDATNFYNFIPQPFSAFGINTIGAPGSNTFIRSLTLNSFVSKESSLVYLNAQRTGSPSNLANGGVSLFYQFARS